jgi:hypothetical protein
MVSRCPSVPNSHSLVPYSACAYLDGTPASGPYTSTGPLSGRLATMLLHLEQKYLISSNQPAMQGTQVRQTQRRQQSAPATLGKHMVSGTSGRTRHKKLQKLTFALAGRPSVVLSWSARGKRGSRSTVVRSRVGRVELPGPRVLVVPPRQLSSAAPRTLWAVDSVVRSGLRAGL